MALTGEKKNERLVIIYNKHIDQVTLFKNTPESQNTVDSG